MVDRLRRSGMLKKVTWTENAIFSIRLRDDLYSLVQMRKTQLMQFFDLSKTTSNWCGTDLRLEKTLFFVYGAEKNLKPLFEEQLNPDQVTPSSEPIEMRMLGPVFSSQGNGANLVELPVNYDPVGARVIKSGLTAENDLDLILAYETTGMLGDPEKLRKRLVRYFDTGVNWDDSKQLLFPAIMVPPPHYRGTK